MLKRNFLRHLLGAALLAAAGAAIAAPAPKVLVLGDSLSAEYGLTRDTGWVKLLADRTRHQGYPHEV
ncbi:MAG: arylesterase, partial [Betaproteobacteria bacterium]